MGDEPKTKDESKPILTPQETEMRAKLDTLEKENAALLRETLAKKEQIRDLETKKQAEEQERLKEQNRFKELYETSQPKVKRLEEIEPVFASILETEIAEVPEAKRDLIPQFEKPEQKLLWLRQAKSKGLFSPTFEGTPAGNKPATVQSKVNANQNLPEFVSWAGNDPRLTSLNTDQYQLWKRHNTKTTAGIKGWGRN